MSVSLAAAMAVTACLSPSQPSAPRSSLVPPPPSETGKSDPVGKLVANKSVPYRVLLKSWEGPHGGVPPWDKIELSWFTPAFEHSSEELLKEVERVVDSSEPPTFSNTIVALEQVGKPLERFNTLFYTLASSRSTPEVEALAKTLRPKFSDLQDKIDFNPKLFSRVHAVYKARDTAGLTMKQKRLVEKKYEHLVQRGARLTPETKAKVAQINMDLAKLFAEFDARVLADEDTWIILPKKALKGLPDSLVASYKAAAEKRGLEGYAVVNTRSAVDPFLTFSVRRDLRQRVWTAFKSRGDNGDEHDTNDLIVKIVKLRAQRAKLLGFESHAHWRLNDKMAKTPNKAMELMLEVWPAAKKRVKKEVAMMRRIARNMGQEDKIRPWDYLFYLEKVRSKKYDFDQNEFKQYFELNNLIKASYYMAERLYGLVFNEITGQVPVFHADVRVFEVRRKEDNSYVGMLYRDDFARQYKRSGAWMSSYRGQSHIDGNKVYPIVSNNNNFIKPADNEPALISLDDAKTLFHEFGHALHYLLNNTTYPSLAETPRDFVEYPSQVHENWVLTRAVLDKYARHYKTGKAMPKKLIERMRAAATHGQGYATVEYLAAAIVDMKLHMASFEGIEPKAFEKKVLGEIGMPEEISMRHRLPSFQHLFSSDGYSAGYYSYLWSDVMAVDTWLAFTESGDEWHPEVAKKFETIILSTGDAVERAEAYRQFRGRDPKVEALLKDRGL